MSKNQSEYDAAVAEFIRKKGVTRVDPADAVGEIGNRRVAKLGERTYAPLKSTKLRNRKSPGPKKKPAAKIVIPESILDRAFPIIFKLRQHNNRAIPAAEIVSTAFFEANILDEQGNRLSDAAVSQICAEYQTFTGVPADAPKPQGKGRRRSKDASAEHG